MPATDNQSSFLNRISIRRNQVSSMEHDQENENIELFSKHVVDYFADLLPSHTSSTTNADPSSTSLESPAPDLHPDLLSICWFQNLLDIFLCCEAEFKAAVVMGRDPLHFGKPPLDRLIPELLDRAVKALDVCNAVSSGLDLTRQWQKLAQIAVSSLEQKPIGEGQVRRARKALNNLLTSMMLDDRDGNYHGKGTDRSWSFGRRGGGGASKNDRTGGSFRPLSCSVAKSWSAAKQVQAMSSNLVAPKAAEQTGLASPVYIMSTVMVFVMWSLVAAIPCQERTGLQTHLNVPRQLEWAKPITVLQEKIGEEWKKKEKRGAAGVLDEIKKMEKLAKSLVEFADSFNFPLEEEKVVEVAEMVAELAEVCQKMEEGLPALQLQVREVFHRIVRSRSEILDVVDQNGKASLPPVLY
ncbi:hypothetical protein Leryth_008934 [Lithospermum erythrorhizon]|uniref:Uncharacterized protein n=1 Tax=Lithospermum erythrorhizon TaxID=34254 RepID=A0AAV3P3L8_LITER|nr:hypothetical protein Leryth_008934 [Lithospermum erythrorhizon]